MEQVVTAACNEYKCIPLLFSDDCAIQEVASLLGPDSDQPKWLQGLKSVQPKEIDLEGVAKYTQKFVFPVKTHERGIDVFRKVQGPKFEADTRAKFGVCVCVCVCVCLHVGGCGCGYMQTCTHARACVRADAPDIFVAADVQPHFLDFAAGEVGVVTSIFVSLKTLPSSSQAVADACTLVEGLVDSRPMGTDSSGERDIILELLEKEIPALLDLLEVHQTSEKSVAEFLWILNQICERQGQKVTHNVFFCIPPCVRVYVCVYACAFVHVRLCMCIVVCACTCALHMRVLVCTTCAHTCLQHLHLLLPHTCRVGPSIAC